MPIRALVYKGEGLLGFDHLTWLQSPYLASITTGTLAWLIQSRGALRDPSGDVAESGRRFLRRRELTRRSIVRTGYLV